MNLTRSTPLRNSTDHDWGDVDPDGYRYCQNNGCTARWFYASNPHSEPEYPCRGGLARSELDSGSGPAPVSDRRSEKRPDLGTPLEAYVEGLDCLLAGHPEHRCRGDVVAHHVRHKAHAGDWTTRGGQKVGNLIPLCSVNGHQGGPESVHEMGRSSFEERWGLSLAAEAARIGSEFQARERTQ